jgi:hypothetical protein
MLKMLSDEQKKSIIKIDKKTRVNCVNSLNMWHEPWDGDNNRKNNS